MDDLIPRAAAYDVIGEMIKEYREKGEDDLADGMIIARRYGIKRLPAVDAIPVEWVRKWPKDLREGAYVRDILRDWQKEQEAR